MSKAAQTNTLNIIDHFSFATVNICLIKLFFFCPHQSQQQQQPPIVISRALRWSNQSIFQSLFHFFILTRTYKVEKLSEDLFKTRLVHFFRAVSLASLFSVLILLGAIVITIIISEARFFMTPSEFWGLVCLNFVARAKAFSGKEEGRKNKENIFFFILRDEEEKEIYFICWRIRMIANNGSVDDDVKNTNSTKQTKGEGKTNLRVEKLRGKIWASNTWAQSDLKTQLRISQMKIALFKNSCWKYFRLLPGAMVPLVSYSFS